MTTGAIQDPYVNFNFLVEIDGITRAAFQEVSGLNVTIDVIEHREGGENTTPRKLAGKTKYDPLSCKFGMTDKDSDLYTWFQNAVDGNIERKNGSIVLHDRAGKEVARWEFVRGFPSKCQMGQLSAEGNDVMTITMEIVHEGLKRA